MERPRAALTLDAGRGSGAGRAGERGFTIAELTVTLIVTVEIILATLLLFDASGKIGKAEVQIAGQHWTAQGGTGGDGKVTLALHGELPATVAELLIKPRADAWGLWQRCPLLRADAVNTVTLRALPETKAARSRWCGNSPGPAGCRAI